MKKISVKSAWKNTDGWRGYYQPIFAVCGANDTGGWDDSPCPTSVRIAELKKAKAILRKAGIPFKQVMTRTSNVFCVHFYLVAHEDDVEKAKDLIAPIVHDCRLLYIA